MRTSFGRFAIACLAGTLLAGTASANQNNTGQGGGYHGGAKFNDGSMIGVGPYPDFGSCDAALNSAISSHATIHGLTLVLKGPCHYRSGFTFGEFVDNHWHVTDFVVPIIADTPDGAMAMSRAIDEEIRRLREQYQIDDYEAGLKAIEAAASAP